MILGLAGYARSGKDTVADYLVENHGFTKISFANPMREALVRLDPIITINGGATMHLSQGLASLTWEDLKAMSPDIRPLLQRMGTEVGRNMFGENIWVDLAMKEASKYDKVVFADVRFKNEADAVRSNKGAVWRIERPGVEAANSHSSEHDLDEYPCDATLKNQDDIESLGRIVEQALELQKMFGLP